MEEEKKEVDDTEIVKQAIEIQTNTERISKCKARPRPLCTQTKRDENDNKMYNIFKPICVLHNLISKHS